VGGVTWLGDVISSMGTVCTALLTTGGASFLILEGPAGSCVTAGSVSDFLRPAGSCVTAGLTSKGEGVGTAPGTGT
jgi:hypothetical protein